ncbi:MAG TPA: tetratricopeptide repeat protein [Blastocatellia bacterium]|nr:tetratricopeptide repeat protein [Blastocatellia bacterium]
MASLTRQENKVYEFGPFRLEVAERLLLRDCQPVPIAPKVLDTLIALVENGGRLITKDSLMSLLWPDTFVEEGAITRNISDLRKILGEAAGGDRYIETVPRHGYRFVAPVTCSDDGSSKSAAAINPRPDIGNEQSDSSRRGENHIGLSYPVGIAGAKVNSENGGAAEPVTGGDPASASEHRTAVEVPSVSVALSKRRSLQAAAAIALILFGLAGIVLYRHSKAGPAVSPPGIRSIAVLPLENLSGDPAEEYFADGMTESLISGLARIRALKVISRTSIMRYKGIRKSLPDIARELNVDAVIEGTVQRSGTRVRVTAQLINATTDTHLWARDYDRELTDVLKLQSEIARAVADEIRVQVTAQERARLASAGTIDPRAHEAYLLGRFQLRKGDRAGLKLAIDNFERAISLAPDYAAAYAGLSDTWLNRGIFELNFKLTEASARAAALKAVAFDESLADAHIALGNTKFNYDWEWAGGESEFRRALDLDPGSSRAHSDYGYLLMALGRHEEAIEQGSIAVELDPLSSDTQSALGRSFYRAGRVEEAIPHLERAVELEPTSIGARFKLGEAYIRLGKFEEAIRAFNGDELGLLRVYSLTGKQREARQLLRRLKEPPISIAAVYASLGEKDEAFRILERAVDERSAHLVYLKEDPPLEALHSDPRWKALLHRMNFPE